MLLFVSCSFFVFFFFFKQKTAYEMRISDWSSDVCSSDLLLIADTVGVADDSLTRSTGDNATRLTLDGAVDGLKAGRWVIVEGQRSDEIGRASCRERVCQYV